MTSSSTRDLFTAAPLHAVAPAHAATATPHELYGELFVAVQMARVFGDGKSFVDARPKTAPSLIRARFEAALKIDPDYERSKQALAELDAPAAPAVAK